MIYLPCKKVALLVVFLPKMISICPFLSQTPVNVNVEESDLLKDVRYRRHRQELMYRIAHINKDKTKLLFQTVGPPYYVDMKTQEGLRRYYPQLMEVGVFKILLLKKQRRWCVFMRMFMSPVKTRLS